MLTLKHGSPSQYAWTRTRQPMKLSKLPTASLALLFRHHVLPPQFSPGFLQQPLLPALLIRDHPQAILSLWTLMQHAEPDLLLTPAIDVGPLAIGPRTANSASMSVT